MSNPTTVLYIFLTPTQYNTIYSSSSGIMITDKIKDTPMNHEKLEQAASDAYGEHEMRGDVGTFAGINKMQPEDIAKYFYRDGFIAGASWREQQAKDSSAKLLAKKDAEIRELCQLIIHTFSFVEENKDFFWLGDNIHSVYYSEANTIKKAKALLGEE